MNEQNKQRIAESIASIAHAEKMILELTEKSSINVDRWMTALREVRLAQAKLNAVVNSIKGCREESVE